MQDNHQTNRHSRLFLSLFQPAYDRAVDEADSTVVLESILEQDVCVPDHPLPGGGCEKVASSPPVRLWPTVNSESTRNLGTAKCIPAICSQSGLNSVA